MRITETDNELDINVCRILCDDEFKPAPPPPLAAKPFIYLFVGAKGSGKTTTAVSLLSSKKPPYKAYYGTQHEIILNIPKNSLESINNTSFIMSLCECFSITTPSSFHKKTILFVAA